MSSDTDNKLTKYVSATTIVTSDVANMWYGGMYGTSDASAYDADHPLVAGHMHDGLHADGHAQKIHLVEHVTSQLENQNLANESVKQDNIMRYPEHLVANAIPHWKMIDGTKMYFLDLSMSDLGAFKEIENPAGDYSEADHIRTTSSDFTSGGWDFIFGSSSINDIGGAEGTNRIHNDRDKGAFRAGIASSTQWNESSSGSYSVAFGLDNIASGSASGVLSGAFNLSEQDGSVVCGGDYNEIVEGSGFEPILSATCGGYQNKISGNSYSFIGGGHGNQIEEDSNLSSVVGGGGTAAQGVSGPNIIQSGSRASFLGGGTGCNISGGSPYSFIGGGWESVIGSGLGYGSIVGGIYNEFRVAQGLDSGRTNYAFIGGGHSNKIGGVYPGSLPLHSSWIGGVNYCGISSGYGNELEGAGCYIGGGANNLISNIFGETIWESSKEEIEYCSIAGGRSNSINKAYRRSGSSMFVGGGRENSIGSSEYSSVSGGAYNDIDGMALCQDLEKASVDPLTGIPDMIGANTHITTVANSIIGGAFNKINYNIDSFLMPDSGVSDPLGNPIPGLFGLKLGSVAQYSISHGKSARSYICNQASHGGGHWDWGVDAYGNPQPMPAGQRQTSVIVVSTEVTGGSDSDGHPSQVLGPAGNLNASSTTEVLADGLFSTASSIYVDAITVPVNTAVTAKLTWVALWHHPVLGPPGAVATGEMWAVIAMGNDPTGSATIMSQGATNRSPGNPSGGPIAFNCTMQFEEFTMPAGFSSAGIILPRIALDFEDPSSPGDFNVNDYVTNPIRISGRLEWTQVYMEPPSEP